MVALGFPVPVENYAYSRVKYLRLFFGTEIADVSAPTIRFSTLDLWVDFWEVIVMFTKHPRDILSSSGSTRECVLGLSQSL